MFSNCNQAAFLSMRETRWNWSSRLQLPTVIADKYKEYQVSAFRPWPTLLLPLPCTLQSVVVTGTFRKWALRTLHPGSHYCVGLFKLPFVMQTIWKPVVIGSASSCWLVAAQASVSNRSAKTSTVHLEFMLGRRWLQYVSNTVLDICLLRYNDALQNLVISPLSQQFITFQQI